ncbi:MAG: family 4 glycosyl hydrolase [Planctomycetota bacterium]|jgi:alpha-galactosidase
MKIALIGAGSRNFGPSSVRDILVSETLRELPLELALMDIVPDHVEDAAEYARWVRDEVGVAAQIDATTELKAALEGADFAIAAIEVDRYLYWAMDFHVPRMHGLRQVYGENGGVGGIFHALRNMAPMLEIARTMEELCPQATLLNFTNPESKLCEALTRLTSIRTVGLCHGFFQGRAQVAEILGVPPERLDVVAAGINHFTWFQRITDRETGEDLYPRLRQAEREGDWLSDWHEKGMARMLFHELQYFYDPADGHPWESGEVPEFVYSLTSHPTARPWRPQEQEPPDPRERPLKPSGELAVPTMEGLGCGVQRELAAVNVPNRGAVPNLPDDMVVEVPAVADGDGLRASDCEPLPEAIAAMLRLQGSIHKLIVEAFAERSRDKLIQAVLLDPTVDSYRRAVETVDELCRLQADVLPPLG